MLYQCMFSREGETTDTYYESILKEVETLMKGAQFAEACTILDEKLSIPCILREYEESLIVYYSQCRNERKWKDTAVWKEGIETLLEGSLEETLLVIGQLKENSIHNHMDAVADYLSQNPHCLVCPLIIEATMRQNITDEVSMDIDGLEVTFSPCSLDMLVESEGALGAMNYLKDWFENDNPTFTMMCVGALVREAYLRLPFNTEEDEVLPLAAVVTIYMSHTYEEHKAWMFFEEERSLVQYRGYELLLRKHEM